MTRKRPYTVPNISLDEPTNAEDVNRTDTIETLEDITTLQPGKSAQLAAKKISWKCKKLREANKRKNKSEIKTSKIKTANKIRKKYEKLRRDKTKKLAQIKGKEIIEEPKPSSKSARIAAKK